MDKKEKAKKLNTNIKFTILAIVLIAIFCISITPVTFQNDTFYTIKIGEHIVQSGIDMKDPFSWHENLSYTYPHWLYDLLTYFIYSAFGFNGLYISTCILSAILGISIFLVNKKLVKNEPISFLITIGAMYLLKDYIAARAQLVTFILFILTILFIEKFLEIKKIRYGVVLLIIPILISNLHVAVFPFYFILYLPYIAEYILANIAEIIIYRKLTVSSLKIKIKKLSKIEGKEKEVEELKQKLATLEEKIDKIKIKRSKELQNPYKIRMTKNKNVKWLILIMIISILTGFLTPIGTTPYTYLIKTMQGNTTQNINEHLPLTLINSAEVLITIIIFLAILIFTKAKIRLSDLFMLGGLCYLMFMSRRQISMFVIICSLILNRLIIELITIYLGKEVIEKITKKFVSTIGMLVISIGVLALSYYMAKDKVNDKYINESEYPVAACDYIIENIDLGTAKFYNEYNYGSYMLYRGIPVFIDSRADLYAPEFSGKEEDIFMDFIETSGISVFYEDIFNKYGITHIIVYENSKVSMIIDKTQPDLYNELYRDGDFVIYERVRKTK